MVFIVEKDIKRKQIHIIALLSAFLLCRDALICRLLVSVGICLNFHIAVADTVNQKKHHGIFVVTNEMRCFRGIDASGKYSKDIQYTQDVVNLYGEYEMTNRVTVMAKIIGVYSMLMDQHWFAGRVKARSIGLDEANVAIKTSLFRSSRYFKLSAIVGFSSPSVYKANEASQFAIRTYKQISGLELGLFGEYDFFIISSNYHWNIDYWYNEIRLECVYGHHFTDNILFIIRFQKFFSYVYDNNRKMKNANSIDNNVFNYYLRHGFTKLTVSFAFQLLQNITCEIGAYSTIKTKFLRTQDFNLNMTGIYMSIWIKF